MKIIIITVSLQDSAMWKAMATTRDRRVRGGNA